MFYRSEVNVVFGDPEHGKTWLVLAACAEVLQTGGCALVADLDHNGASAIVSRLLLLGAPKEALRDPNRFRLCEPGDAADVVRMVADCAGWCPDVVVIDSTSELLPMFNANSDNADDFTKIHNRVLQPLAKTGAAVLLVDHLAKSPSSRQLGPGGSIAKRRTVGGVSLRVVRDRPFTLNSGGSARLLVNKDRHGGVREHCAVVRQSTNGTKDHDEQLAGTFVLDVRDGGVATWRVIPVQDTVSETARPRKFRPTNLMERASCLIEENPGKFTRNQVAKTAGGRKESTILAVDLLEEEGFITRAAGADTYKRCTSVRPYREREDPASDCYASRTDGHSDE